MPLAASGLFFAIKNKHFLTLMITNFTPSLCHINLDALKRNFMRLGLPNQLMPVIKADAYGHGLLQAAGTLENAGAVQVAVGIVNEGVQLRINGFKPAIYCLMGCLSDEDWQNALQNNIVPVIGNFEDLKKASALASKFKIAIKCNTGMNRLGFSLNELSDLIEYLESNSSLIPDILISHLACADMPEQDDFTQKQADEFAIFYNALYSKFPALKKSLYNSAATLLEKDKNSGIKRPGIAIYGGNPLAGNGQFPHDKKLEWVMSISAPVLQTRSLKCGQSISYGRIFTAKKDMIIAIIGIGYAAGLNRSLSNKISMLINGKRARQIGRICMGMTMADISAIPETKAGDRAWILGGSAIAGEKPVDAQEMADILNTIPYEILCIMGSLNPRVYHY